MRNKKLLKGLKNAKEGRVTIVKTIEDIFKKDEREKYLYYRVYLYFYRLFWRIIRLPGEIRRNIRDFIQRGIRGYANSDTWGFNYYLAKVISGGVKHLKEICHSLPTWKEGKSELECINEWDCILNTIINTFEIAKNITDNNTLYLPTSTWSEKEYKRFKKFAKNSKFHYRVLTKKEAREYERGFDYFKKYFFHLWD